MPFEFVDNNAAIGRAARKRIRSHVAIGRNAGKTLVRPSRKKAFGVRVEPATAPDKISNFGENAQELKGSKDIVLQVDRPIGDGLSFLLFPTQTPKSSGLVYRAFCFLSGPRQDPKLRNAIDSTRGHDPMWVQLMFLDEAYFHCAVAVSVTALNNLVMKQEDPMEAIHHMAHAFRLINERLSGNDAVSNATMAVIVNLTQYERLQGQYRRGVIHLEGLKRIVELRGGISQLTRDKAGLTRKIFRYDPLDGYHSLSRSMLTLGKRADLEYAIHLGSPTRFSIEEIAYVNTAVVELIGSFRLNGDERLSAILDSSLVKSLSPNLQNLLIDITCFAWLVNDADTGHRPQLAGSSFHDTLLYFGYRLVRFRPLAGLSPASSLDNTVHLGLTAFIMTFFLGLDGKIAELPLLAELTRTATQIDLDNKLENQEMLLWILFIGAASIFRLPNDSWLLPKMAQTMQSLGLHNLEDVNRTLAKFPWVKAIHDKAIQLYISASYSRSLVRATLE